MLYCHASFCSGCPMAAAIAGECPCPSLHPLAHAVHSPTSLPPTLVPLSKVMAALAGQMVLSYAKAPTTNCSQVHAEKGTCPCIYFFPLPSAVVSGGCAPRPPQKKPSPKPYTIKNRMCSPPQDGGQHDTTAVSTSPAPIRDSNKENIILCEM